MRHSFFFGTCDEADAAENHIQLHRDDIADIFQTNDGDSSSIEVRFYTESKIGSREQRYLLKATQPDSYAMNCDE